MALEPLSNFPITQKLTRVCLVPPLQLYCAHQSLPAVAFWHLDRPTARQGLRARARLVRDLRRRKPDIACWPLSTPRLPIATQGGRKLHRSGPVTRQRRTSTRSFDVCPYRRL